QTCALPISRSVFPVRVGDVGRPRPDRRVRDMTTNAVLTTAHHRLGSRVRSAWAVVVARNVAVSEADSMADLVNPCALMVIECLPGVVGVEVHPRPDITTTAVAHYGLHPPSQPGVGVEPTCEVDVPCRVVVPGLREAQVGEPCP